MTRTLMAVLIAFPMLAILSCEPQARVPDISDTPLIRVGMIPFTGYAPLYVTEEWGVCDEYGFQLELIETEEQSSLDTLMAKAEADIGAYANTSLAFARAAGLPLRAFLTLDQSSGADGVVVTSEISSIPDLVKQEASLAADPTDVNYFLFMAMAAELGLEPSDFRHSPLTGAHALAAFLSGQVDAVGVSDPGLQNALQRPGSRILISSADMPGLISDVFVAEENTIREKIDDLVAFSRCWYATLDRIESDWDSAVVVMAERLELEPEILNLILEGIDWPPREDGHHYLIGGDLANSLQFANEFYVLLGNLPTLLLPLVNDFG